MKNLSIAAAFLFTCLGQVPAQGKPDLVVVQFTNGDTTLRAGTSASFVVRVNNRSKTSAPGSILGIVLSSDATITRDDQHLGFWKVGEVRYNVPRQATVTVRVPYCAAGTLYVGAIADIGELVGESDETNNTSSLQRPVTAYTGSRKDVSWVGRFPNEAGRSWFYTSSGGSERLSVTAPQSKGYWYLLVWSHRNGFFFYDSLSAFSLGLVNTPLFSAWFGRTGQTTGKATAAFALPKGLPVTVSAWIHSVWFAPDFRFVGFGDNRVQHLIRPSN